MPLTVLLVEDDQGDALLVKRSLAQCGTRCQIEHVTSLQQACEKLEDSSADIVLLDLTLADSRILEGVTKLRTAFPRIPIVVLTNLEDDKIALEAIERGAQDYVVKSSVESDGLERAMQYAVQRNHVLLENQRLVRELENVARRDPLTGLLNRYHFSQELAREWNRFQRNDRVMSCVLMDVDFFKRINDLHGHRTGDEVLHYLSMLLREACRLSDSVARYGGEEFCAILPETDEQGAARWADRLRAVIAESPLLVAGESISLTLSFGVASSTPEMKDPDELVDQADQALMFAKQTGRNQVVRYSSMVGEELNDQADRVDRFDGVLVTDVMSPIVAPLIETQSLLTAVRFMLMLRLESIPVVDDEGHLCGLVTEEDLITRAMTRETWTGTIGAAMSQRPVCFEADTPARVVCEFLGRIALRRVVIVRDKRPVGVVSRTGILRWLRNQFIAEAPGTSGSVMGSSGESVELTALVGELVSEVADLQTRVHDNPQQIGPLLITKASRMQEMLDDLLGLTPAGHGDDITTGSIGHLLG